MSGKDLGRSLQFLSMGVLPSGFQTPFLSSLPHASGGEGRGKKEGQVLGHFEECAFTKLWVFSLPGTLIT